MNARNLGYANATYAAEAMAARLTWPKGTPDLAQVDARAYIGSILEAEVPEMEVIVTLRDSGNPGTGWQRDPWEGKPAEIRFTRHGLTRPLVLHEVSHLLLPGVRGHPKVFRSTLLSVCDRHLPKYGRNLRTAFRHFKIEVDPR